MRRYLLSRIVQNVITFFLFLTVVYFIMDAQPGDFGNIYMSDPRLTPEQRAVIRHNLGLDRPPVERYMIWMGNFLQGEFGISFSNYPRSVLDVLAERAPRTIVLFTTSTIVSFYLGFVTGKILAWNRSGWIEYTATIGGVTLYTVFTPWFGLMMIWLFAFTLDLFPIGKFIDPMLWRASPFTAGEIFLKMLLTVSLASVVLVAALLIVNRVIDRPTARRRAQWLIVAGVLLALVGYWAFLPEGAATYALDIVHHMILPITTLTLISFAGTMLLTRNSMLETLREDYILAARAKGLSEKVIRDKHAARNALLPVVTALVFSLAFVLSGGVITESIFSWPGMGQTLLTAAQQQDLPTAVGALVFTGAVALIAHMIADILYAFLDPRIRYQE